MHADALCGGVARLPAERARRGHIVAVCDRGGGVLRCIAELHRQQRRRLPSDRYVEIHPLRTVGGDRYDRVTDGDPRGGKVADHLGGDQRVESGATVGRRHGGTRRRAGVDGRELLRDRSRGKLLHLDDRGHVGGRARGGHRIDPAHHAGRDVGRGIHVGGHGRISQVDPGPRRRGLDQREHGGLVGEIELLVGLGRGVDHIGEGRAEEETERLLRGECALGVGQTGEAAPHEAGEGGDLHVAAEAPGGRLAPVEGIEQVGIGQEVEGGIEAKHFADLRAARGHVDAMIVEQIHEHGREGADHLGVARGDHHHLVLQRGRVVPAAKHDQPPGGPTLGDLNRRAAVGRRLGMEVVGGHEVHHAIGDAAAGRVEVDRRSLDLTLEQLLDL